ncbi:Transposase DDE domain group 1 [Modicisalibacter muralis]|uniref:Transposase DDE domain group 1 n=1 Tax=Modicisalibacter muralis TaxID=119000 RepID=A0A1G9LMJ0_9GAMM|nr:Transposase DDE domain group 1 [Halomonas muralis]
MLTPLIVIRNAVPMTAATMIMANAYRRYIPWHRGAFVLSMTIPGILLGALLFGHIPAQLIFSYRRLPDPGCLTSITLSGSRRRPEIPRDWCYNLTYEAGAWPAPRRVVLQERPDDLWFHTFFLVTNLNRFDHSPQEVLACYRRRGKAEAHMGELKSVLDIQLSSMDRGASTVQDVMARNQASLLLSLYAYELMHALCGLMEKETRHGWSLARLREQVLKVAATVTVHARRITLHLGPWPTNGGRHCSRGSPVSRPCRNASDAQSSREPDRIDVPSRRSTPWRVPMPVINHSSL